MTASGGEGVLQHIRYSTYLGTFDGMVTYSPERCANLCPLCSLNRKLSALATLARNLRDGAALCGEFFRGFSAASGPRPIDWRPGCQRPAPGTPPTASKGAGR